MTNETKPTPEEARERMLADPRWLALVGLAHHALNFTEAEVAKLVGLPTGTVKAILRDFLTTHQTMIRTPAGILAVELRRQSAPPTTAA